MSYPAGIGLPFRPTRSLTRWVIALLVVQIVLNLVAMVLDGLEIGLISRALRGGVVSEAELGSNAIQQAFVGITQTLVFLVTAVLFLIWMYRSHRNLSALGAEGLRFRGGWVVGYWFIPVLNLYRPYQVMREIWQGSDPSVLEAGEQWRTVPSSALLGWWWAMWLASSVFGRISTRLALRAATGEGLLLSGYLSVLVDCLWIVAAVLAIAVVQAVTTRQEKKWYFLRYPPRVV